MSKEYLEALDWLEEKCYVESPQAEKFEECCKIIRQSLHRLESIDNANPIEALKDLEFISHELKAYYEHLYIILRSDKKELTSNMKRINTYLDVIKLTLLKAETPKHYLKWENLEFEHTPKYIDVKMSGNKYKLVVGYNVAGKNLAILRDGKNEYYFLEYDKQFFNDLHLERVLE